jgi:hypothetical protein
VEIPVVYVDQVYAAFSQYENSLRANKRSRISSNRRSAAQRVTNKLRN